MQYFSEETNNDLAFDEPNLFKYLYLSGDSGFQAGGFDILVNADTNAAMVEQIADCLKISKENVKIFFRTQWFILMGFPVLSLRGL